MAVNVLLAHNCALSWTSFCTSPGPVIKYSNLCSRPISVMLVLQNLLVNLFLSPIMCMASSCNHTFLSFQVSEFDGKSLADVKGADLLIAGTVQCSILMAKKLTFSIFWKTNYVINWYILWMCVCVPLMSLNTFVTYNKCTVFANEASPTEDSTTLPCLLYS